MTNNNSSSSPIYPTQLHDLLKRQEFRCALSDRPLEPETAEIDHRVPLADGGRNDVDNLQWIETTINRAKGAMGNDAFVALCESVATKHARDAWTAAWAAYADEIAADYVT